MRKHLCMTLLAVLAVFSVTAHDLTEQLCQDETFITAVTEAKELTDNLRTLPASQREAYLASEDFACINTQLVQRLTKVVDIYALDARADRQELILAAAKQVGKTLLNDPDECWYMFIIAYGYCDAVYGGGIDPVMYAFCTSSAWYQYEACFAPPGMRSGSEK